ncbi:MAG TPA: DUF4340 domain-containing protein [Anaerolineales bacterium]
MIRRSTWIVLASLAALIGLSFYLREQKSTGLALATPTKGMAPLLDVAASSPTMIKMESSLGVVVQFSRDDTGKWVLQQPEATAADQAAAEAAATQVGALKVLSTVDLGSDVIGLDNPKYTLTVGLGTNVTHTVRIGSVTPIQDGYYVRLDAGPAQVVDKLGLDELIGLLSNPPYLATPTPGAAPTPAASASPSGELPTATSGTADAAATTTGTPAY